MDNLWSTWPNGIPQKQALWVLKVICEDTSDGRPWHIKYPDSGSKVFTSSWKWVLSAGKQPEIKECKELQTWMKPMTRCQH